MLDTGRAGSGCCSLRCQALTTTRNGIAKNRIRGSRNVRTKVAGESCGATNASNGTSCASLLSRSEGSFILARAARQLVEGRIQKRAPQAFYELPTRICLRLSLAGGWCQITRGSCGRSSQCDMTGRMPRWLSRRCHCPPHTALFTGCDADLIH